MMASPIRKVFALIVAALLLAVSGMLCWRVLRAQGQSTPAVTEDTALRAIAGAGSADRPAESLPPALVDAGGHAGADVAIDTAFDSAAPVGSRLAAVEALGLRRDEAAARTLLALSERDGPLRAPAIAALGGLPPDARVALRLRALVALPDPQALAAAVRSLGRQEGAAAVPVIGDTLRRNRRRPDGYEDVVCGACVEALGAIGSPAAVPILAGELDQTVGRELQFDYGSQIVFALRSIGHASARPALVAYGGRLRAEQAAQRENPLGRQYLGQKIAEVDAALDSLP